MTAANMIREGRNLSPPSVRPSVFISLPPPCMRWPTLITSSTSSKISLTQPDSRHWDTMTPSLPPWRFLSWDLIFYSKWMPTLVDGFFLCLNQHNGKYSWLKSNITLQPNSHLHVHCCSCESSYRPTGSNGAKRNMILRAFATPSEHTLELT